MPIVGEEGKKRINDVLDTKHGGGRTQVSTTSGGKRGTGDGRRQVSTMSGSE